jgi:hypothetical protein
LVTSIEGLVRGSTTLGAFLGLAAVALNYNRARAKIKAAFTEPMLLLPARALPEGAN